MATAAGGVLELGIDDRLDVRIGVGAAHSSAEGSPRGQWEGLALVSSRPDARAPDRVMEEQFAEVALRLSCLKTRAGRHGYAGVSGRNLQFIDSPNLLTDELAQLGGAVAL